MAEFSSGAGKASNAKEKRAIELNRESQVNSHIVGIVEIEAKGSPMPRQCDRVAKVMD